MSDAFERLYPTLAAWMTQEQWEDRTPRRTTTLLFFVERGQLKCCLHDRDAGRSAFLTGDTVEELLGEVERSLAADVVEWRVKRS